MDFFRRTDDGRNQVEPGVAQEPLDPFNGMFCGRGLGYRQTMSHRDDAEQRLQDQRPHQC